MKTHTMILKEIACLYFPQSSPRCATIQLKKWMRGNTMLLQSLEDCGYVNGQRFLTPKQVGLIFQHFGEP